MTTTVARWPATSRPPAGSRPISAKASTPKALPAPLSRTMAGNGRWRFISATSRTKPCCARWSRSPAAAALTIEPVAPADWVKQSLAGLKPVRAGRCIVHGAHDRARVKPNDIGIEIEAALAFGTGHHGTTRGCLLALDELAKRQRNFSIPPLKGEGRHRRPLAAVLGSKNADAKHRLWRSEDRGGVKQRSNDPH